MLDWFTGVIGCDGSQLRADQVCRIEPTGHVLWSSDCWIECKGSYESSIALRQRDRPIGVSVNEGGNRLLQISGNPVKYLQGHNAFGLSVALYRPVVDAVIKGLPDQVRPVDLPADKILEMWPSRIDIAVSIDMGTYGNVKEWLRCISTGSRSRHGRALVSGDTVYWGQHSRRWAMKAYCKFDEMLVHPMGDLRLNEQYRQEVKNVLRLELCLRGLELKEINKKGWTLDESLLWWYFEHRISVGRLNMTRVKGLEKLTLSQQAIFLRWISGEVIDGKLKESTFYRYRRVILDTMGVDISIPCIDQDTMLERLAFDIEYLKAHEVTIIPSIFKDRLFRPESFTFSES